MTMKMDRVRKTASVLDGEEIKPVFVAKQDHILTLGGAGCRSQLVDFVVKDVANSWLGPINV